MPSSEELLSYWSASEISVNLLIFLHIVGALLMGLIAGYEVRERPLALAGDVIVAEQAGVVLLERA